MARPPNPADNLEAIIIERYFDINTIINLCYAAQIYTVSKPAGDNCDDE
jgi:hypothetical protein